MIKYIPVDSIAPWTDADQADLLSFDWHRKTAAFVTSADDCILEVGFSEASVIVRLLDELPLSTETNPDEDVGLVPHHFAYRVEGHPFSNAQSELWKEVESAHGSTPEHYRFLTGNGCLDVISSEPPTFRLIDQ